MPNFRECCVYESCGEFEYRLLLIIPFHHSFDVLVQDSVSAWSSCQTACGGSARQRVLELRFKPERSLLGPLREPMYTGHIRVFSRRGNDVASPTLLRGSNTGEIGLTGSLRMSG